MQQQQSHISLGNLINIEYFIIIIIQRDSITLTNFFSKGVSFRGGFRFSLIFSLKNFIISSNINTPVIPIVPSATSIESVFYLKKR